MKLTEQDILSMTNMQKRKDFLSTWTTWPVWVKVLELGMTVYAVDLPEGYSHMTSSTSELTEYLTDLRKEYATAELVDYLAKLPRKTAREDT